MLKMLKNANRIKIILANRPEKCTEHLIIATEHLAHRAAT